MELIKLIEIAYEDELSLIKITELLSNSKTDVNFCSNDNSDTETPLLMAIIQSGLNPDLYKQIIEILFNTGIDVNKSSSNKMTPLILAIETGNINLVKLLLGAGANANTRDKRNETALMYVTSNIIDYEIKYELCKVLLKCGANVNLLDDNGCSVLFRATDSYKLCKLFLKYGANVNLKTEEGFTPLFDLHTYQWANLPDKYNITVLFISYGVNINEIYDGQTVLDYIFSSDYDSYYHDDYFWLFKSAGIDTIYYNSYILDADYLILLKQAGISIRIDSSNDINYMVNNFTKKIIDQMKEIRKIYYNFVFKDIPTNALHIKLKEDNIGAKIVKLNYELKTKSVNEIYANLVKDNLNIINYLHIKDSKDMLEKIDTYIKYLYS